jgi:ABC-type Fe3+ transport system permease subunit
VLFNQVESFDYASANRTALVLVLFCILALVLVYARPVNLTGRPEKRAQ